ncbi:MAG: hypothetical protein PUC47_09630 [Oscillospiraceae bacterium]|nr:hypothetical protein [Oscillospiraceae bacterium]
MRLEWDEMGKRIRACYDAFLDMVPGDRELWEIALLEYYFEEPLEDWEATFPDWLTGLESRLPQLAARKQEICPDAEKPYTVQEKLERKCGDGQGMEIPPEAAGLLLEYYLAMMEYDDDWYGRSLFTSAQADERILTGLTTYNVCGRGTPEEQKALGLWLYEIYQSEKKFAWVFDLLKRLLLTALDSGCGEAGWRLYEILVEEKLLTGADDILRMAAEAGCTDAQEEIGWLFIQYHAFPPARDHWDGDDVRHLGGRISAEEAVHWLEQALPRRSQAGFHLMELFDRGWGARKDEERAIRYCRAVVETEYEGDAGNMKAECQKWLAERCASGRGAPKDRPEGGRAVPADE